MANLQEPPLENGARSNTGKAVMILSDPPLPYRLHDWYFHKITGTSFILLNMLNLQRGGVEDLTLYHPGLNAAALDGLRGDPRLTLEFHETSDTEALRQGVEAGEFRWVFEGSALYRKEFVRRVLEDPQRVEGLRAMTWTDIESMQSGIPAVPGGEQENRDGTPFLIEAPTEYRIRERRDFRRQTEALIKGSGLSNDSLLDRVVTRKISNALTRLFLMTSLTPNQITLIAMAVGLAGAACFWAGGYAAGVAGAALVLLSAWIDCTDGEVARLKFQESPMGGMLDIWADNVVHAAAFFSMGMGLYFSTENGIYKIFGTLAVVGTLASFALLHSSVIESKKRAALNPEEEPEASLVDRVANRDFTYFLFALCLAGRLEIFLALTAVGANVFAVWLVFQKYRSAWSSSTELCAKNSE